MVVALKDVVRCPRCGSAEVIYSCEPKCCFNHVCEQCRATFQLTTRDTGQTSNERAIDAQEPPSTEPTAACAVCQGLRLAVIDPQSATPVLVCADCGRILELAYEDIAA